MDGGEKPQTAIDDEHQMPSWREVFLYFLKLGVCREKAAERRNVYSLEGDLIYGLLKGAKC